MRIQRIIAIALAGLMLLGHAAAEQLLPDIACFSPGLLRVSELEAARAPVAAEAEAHIDSAMYARDLSVLASMLSGATIRYEGTEEAERLSILKEGEAISSLVLAGKEGGQVLEIGGEAYAIESEQSALAALTGLPLAGYDRAAGVSEQLLGVAVLERVPLGSVCAWIESLAVGDALFLGFGVTAPFAVEKTMSDDGTRLTRIDISGQIAKEGEAPYTVSGFLRQPAGRAPKDTFELTITQDEKNFYELSYSALRENEIASKGKRGTTSVRTTLKAAGKVNGDRITTRLTVTTKNAWTADGENLSEKITISAALEHQDNRPGMRMLRLNTVEGKLRNVISLTTNETKHDEIELEDEMTVELVMDGNTCLAAGADVRMRLGGDAPEIAVAAPARAASGGEIAAAAAREAERIAAALYPQLSEGAKEKATSGL